MTSLRDALPESLTTQRLTLDAPHLDDLTELVPLANNDNVTRWTARMPFPYGREDGIAFIETIARSPEQRPYAIRNDDGAFIGIVSLIFASGQRPELGYWIGEPFWGRGYASEAAEALVAAARATGLIGGLAAKAIADNHGSLRVLEKQGFARTGQAIDDCGRNKGKLIVSLELEFER